MAKELCLTGTGNTHIYVKIFSGILYVYQVSLISAVSLNIDL